MADKKTARTLVVVFDDIFWFRRDNRNLDSTPDRIFYDLLLSEGYSPFKIVSEVIIDKNETFTTYDFFEEDSFPNKEQARDLLGDFKYAKLIAARKNFRSSSRHKELYHHYQRSRINQNGR